MTRHFVRLVMALTASVAAVAVAPAAAHAAAVNDDFTGATVIETVPYSTTQDTTDATSDPSDPASCYDTTRESVWFRYTPVVAGRIDVSTAGSGYDTVLSAWTGSQGSLTRVNCNHYWNGSQFSFRATAGTTYYFMVASLYESGGGDLTFSLNLEPSPGNDDFVNAAPITELPFAEEKNIFLATTQDGEPTSCAPFTRTVWYAYTPTTDQKLMASTVTSFGGAIGVYTGDTIADLSQVGCSTQSYDPVAFEAEAGTTYLFQVGGYYYDTSVIDFRLELTPNPQAGFGYYPDRPSIFDTIEFSDRSYDPARASIVSWNWDFGDGATSTSAYPTHQYAADGDYTVTLTVATADGRTATTSSVMPIRTHDVSIVRINVPPTARVGQTIGIQVYVKSTRYPETAEVGLSRGGRLGYEYVGSLTRTVNASPGQTTRFSFSYSVTADDASVGKVTFRAIAWLPYERDAFPTDNELLSTPVKIV